MYHVERVLCQGSRRAYVRRTCIHTCIYICKFMYMYIYIYMYVYMFTHTEYTDTHIPGSCTKRQSRRGQMRWGSPGCWQPCASQGSNRAHHGQEQTSWSRRDQRWGNLMYVCVCFCLCMHCMYVCLCVHTPGSRLTKKVEHSLCVRCGFKFATGCMYVTHVFTLTHMCMHSCK